MTFFSSRLCPGSHLRDCRCLTSQHGDTTKPQQKLMTGAIQAASHGMLPSTRLIKDSLQGSSLANCHFLFLHIERVCLSVQSNYERIGQKHCLSYKKRRHSGLSVKTAKAGGGSPTVEV